MLIVKLGGSVITQKSELKSLREDALKSLVNAMSGVKNLIVVHGAGSYGHIKANEYGLSHGKGTPVQVAEVQADVRELNLHVLRAMIAAGIPAVSIPPASCVVNKNREIHDVNFDAFDEFLDSGFIPVTFGDVVYDIELGHSICSGDDLMVELGTYFNVEKAIYVMDTDGVADKKGDIIRDGTSINPDASYLTEKEDSDVTGSIRHKVECCHTLYQKGHDVWLIGNNPEHLRTLLTHDELDAGTSWRIKL